METRTAHQNPWNLRLANPIALTSQSIKRAALKDLNTTTGLVGQLASQQTLGIAAQLRPAVLASHAQMQALAQGALKDLGTTMGLVGQLASQQTHTSLGIAAQLRPAVLASQMQMQMQALAQGALKDLGTTMGLVGQLASQQTLGIAAQPRPVVLASQMQMQMQALAQGALKDLGTTMGLVGQLASQQTRASLGIAARADLFAGSRAAQRVADDDWPDNERSAIDQPERGASRAEVGAALALAVSIIEFEIAVLDGSDPMTVLMRFLMVVASAFLFSAACENR